MKYNLDKQLRIISHFHAPFHQWLFPVSDQIMKCLPRGLRSSSKIKVTKHFIKTSDGYKLSIYEFDPINNDSKKKAIVYLHGGGFAFSFAPYQVKLLKSYCIANNLKGFLIDYRLASHYPYPTPLNDCLEGYNHLLENASFYGIDDSFVMVLGDSAGGCLALDLNEKAERKPDYLLLCYPVCEKPNENYESIKNFPDTPIWNSRLNVKMWDAYLRNIHPEDYTSVIERKNEITNPVYIETCEFDCLSSEGKALYEKIIKTNKEAKYYNVLQACHGFELVFKADITKKAIERRNKEIKEAISKYSRIR